jgi:hypothetical protein
VTSPTDDDLTGDFDLAARERPGPEAPVDEEPYDPDQDRERVRGRIAYGLLALIAGLTITLMVLGAMGRSLDDLTKLHAIILTPLITLTSGIVGFYFGAQTKRD